jgi:hypothetical protein
MPDIPPAAYAALYAGFHSPVTALDCGKRCAPYNERGAPFCCDTRHAVPSAYQGEWQYLRSSTDLWHLWQGKNPRETEQLIAQSAPGQVLIECQGHRLCQRNFRAITCRAFPFFPYLTRQGELIGLCYYWEYEQRCWVISNLGTVTAQYRDEFMHTYEQIFAAHPEDKENFRYHACMMRRVFSRWRRSILLLHREGGFFEVAPSTGQMHPLDPCQLPKFGPYAIAAHLAFPGEA